MNGQRSLVLLGTAPQADLQDRIRTGELPEPEFWAVKRALGAALFPSNAPPGAKLTGGLYRYLGEPRFARSIAEAVGARKNIDFIYTTGEDIGLRLALILKFLSWPGRIIMPVHTLNGSVKKQKLLRFLGSDIFRALICVCHEQKSILVNDVKFPEAKAHFFYNWVDTDFFSPNQDSACPGSYVFSCGLESRDYMNLARAAAYTSASIRINASGFFGSMSSDEALSVKSSGIQVTQKRVSFPDLRDLYRNSRFVVVPLRSVRYAAGVTSVVEAMACGKAVIVTDSPGIRDYVLPGQSGLVVPPQDPSALGAAIQELWDQPERVREMGQRNLAWAKARAHVGDYGNLIRNLVNE